MQIKYTYLDPDEITRSPEFLLVEDFLARTRRTQIGWHYIIDLTWIYGRVRDLAPGQKILDAGGGVGPLQYLLAELGHRVVNVDLHHPELPKALVKRYRITSDRLQSFTPTSYSAHIKSVGNRTLQQRVKRVVARAARLDELKARAHLRRLDAWRREAGAYRHGVGSIWRLQGNLARMPEIQDGEFDVIVSLSSLEHISWDELALAAAELRRVAKADAKWALTTSGTDRPKTWYHEPSRGWCFDDEALDHVFFAQHDGAASPESVLESYRSSAYLRDHMADFYKLSGDNGMPWGRWDPTYVPVGIYAPS